MSLSAEGATASVVPTGAGTASRDGVAAGSTPRPGYEHLARLFVERSRLPEGHPRRERLRNELIAGHLPVARNIARRYAYRGDNPEDLEQVASVGLVLAVDRFDVDRGADVLSFAVPTINGEVLRYFRDRANTIRTPRRLRSTQATILDAVARLGQRLGRAPRPSEIAEHLDVERGGRARGSVRAGGDAYRVVGRGGPGRRPLRRTAAVRERADARRGGVRPGRAP